MKQDYKKLAQERLAKIQLLKVQCDRLKLELPTIIERELTFVLHAHCMCSVGGENQIKIKQCAEFLAERIAPTINSRTNQ
jgi:hypothetical protein